MKTKIFFSANYFYFTFFAMTCKNNSSERNQSENTKSQKFCCFDCDRKFYVSVSVLAEISVSVHSVFRVFVSVSVLISVSVQTNRYFVTFGFGLNLGFSWSLVFVIVQRKKASIQTPLLTFANFHYNMFLLLKQSRNTGKIDAN